MQQCVHYTFSNLGPDLDRNYGGMVMLGLRLFALCKKKCTKHGTCAKLHVFNSL